MIANQHKTVDGIFVAMLRTQQSQQMRFQDLRSLIYNGQSKLLQGKDGDIGTEISSRSHKNLCRLDLLPYFLNILACFHLPFQQIRFVGIITRKTHTHADEINLFLHQLTANLIDRSVGIRDQENGSIRLA